MKGVQGTQKIDEEETRPYIPTGRGGDGSKAFRRRQWRSLLSGLDGSTAPRQHAKRAWTLWTLLRSWRQQRAHRPRKCEATREEWPSSAWKPTSPTSKAAWSRYGLHSKQSIIDKQDESKQNMPRNILRSNVAQFGQYRFVHEDSNPHTSTMGTLGAMTAFDIIRTSGNTSRQPPRRDGSILRMAQGFGSELAVSRRDDG